MEEVVIDFESEDDRDVPYETLRWLTIQMHALSAGLSERGLDALSMKVATHGFTTFVNF